MREMSVSLKSEDICGNVDLTPSVVTSTSTSGVIVNGELRGGDVPLHDCDGFEISLTPPPHAHRCDKWTHMQSIRRRKSILKGT